MKQIFVLKDQPLQKKEYNLIGFNNLNKFYDVKIYNFNKLRDLVKFNLLLNKKTDQIIIDLMSTQAHFITVLIRYLIYSKKKKVIRLYIDCQPKLKFPKNFNFYFHKRIFKKFFSLLTRLKKLTGLKKKLNQYPVDVAIVGVKNDLENVNQKYLKRKMFCHSSAFDYYLKNKLKKCYNKKYALYVDSGLVYHPDFDKLKLKPLIGDRDKYLKNLNLFFNKYEQDTNIKIIIAGHPKINSSFYKKSFKGRKVYLNLTPDLVNYASSIFIDVSTALNFVILCKKPTYFLTCDEFVESQNFHSRLIDFYTIYLSRPKINIDRQLTKKFCHVPLKKNSLRRYDNFINKYIKNSNSSKLNIAQEIAKSIQ